MTCLDPLTRWDPTTQRATDAGRTASPLRDTDLVIAMARCQEDAMEKAFSRLLSLWLRPPPQENERRNGNGSRLTV
jgi:hypothetical protein